MPQMRIRDAAAYLGVSDDTVRRWIDNGVLPADGRRRPAARSSTATRSPGRARARLAAAAAGRRGQLGAQPVRRPGDRPPDDAVMAQVELQCGPFRVVSLM